MKTVYIYIGCLLMMISASSCKKFLDEKPISVSTDETFWKNESDANSAVAAGYALLRKSLNGSDGLAFYAYGDLPADEYTTTQYRFGDVANINWSISVPAAEIGDRMMILRRYDTFYSAIDQANRCIQKIPGIAEGEFSSTLVKDNLIGEAYFLRAFEYFYMARIWGDIPLVTSSGNIVEAVDLARTPQEQILDQCIKDVNEAIRLLSWNYTSANNRAVRANKGAAYALLAHIYAWKGDYTNCSIAADAVLNQNYYQFVNRADFLNIFKGKSTEGIFEISQSEVNEGTISGIALFTLKSPYLSTQTGNAYFTLNQNTVTQLYNNNTDDLRLKNGFALLTTTDPICIKYANITYNNGQNVVTPVAHNNIIIFRLADIKLLKAEALAALNQFDGARTILNEVRGIAGLGNWTGTNANLFEGIIDERGRELFLEGHRFYDLVRLGRKTGILKFGESKMGAADFAAGKYYWPLDPALMNINKKLKQTPFWSSKM
nr:RagB/SusD family nutrient uptake outer membrane protein [uncultured Pedobacter sp.]